MSMSETASDTRRRMEAAASQVPAKAAAARAALVDLGERAKDLVASLQARARDEAARRRSATADSLETLAGALRRGDKTGTQRRRAIAVAGPSLALAVALGAGVALGVVLSRQMKKRADRRAALAEVQATTPKVEAPSAPPVIEQPTAAGAAGLSH